MSSFDFTALLKFLGSLFDAFMKLFEKLGFHSKTYAQRQLRRYAYAQYIKEYDQCGRTENKPYSESNISAYKAVGLIRVQYSAEKEAASEIRT